MKNELINKKWDLIVIGGGITGAGIFREAVRNGLTTLLVEQKDFAWGTSSRSSKLVHGGLRYLKEGNFVLTHESVIERERLIREAPGLVEPLDFHLPLYKGKKPGKWMMGAGLFIYDLISKKMNHRYYERDAFMDLIPMVNSSGLTGGFTFMDAQVDDARLVMRLINDAEKEGGTAQNYTRVVSLLRNSKSRINGAVLEDVESKEKFIVNSDIVINATGVWAETLHRSPEKNKHLRPLRGSHLVFSEKTVPIKKTVSFFSPDDGRHLFVIPWEGAVLVGTTDLDHSNKLSVEPKATSIEIKYLLNGINSIFPSLKLTLNDVVSCFSGIRPVVSEGKVSADQESRDHVIWKDNGLITVTGGKLTTFRKLAYDTLYSIIESFPGKNITHSIDSIFEQIDFTHIPSVIPQNQIRMLTGRYGKDVLGIIEKTSSDLLEIIPGTHTLWCELAHVANEKVRHLDDLLLRRVRIGLLLKKGGIDYFDRIKSCCEPVLNWGDEKWDKEFEMYKNLWERYYNPHVTTN